MTGSYDLSFQVFDSSADTETVVPLSKTGVNVRPNTVRPLTSANNQMAIDSHGAAAEDFAGGYFDRKVLNFSYSSSEDVVAIAGMNNLFIYSAVV